MSEIKAITTTTGATYEVVDRFSQWGGNNLTKNIPRSHDSSIYCAYVLNLIENLQYSTTYTLQFWDTTVSRADRPNPYIRVYWGGGSLPITGDLRPDTNGYICTTFTTPAANQLTSAALANSQNAYLNCYNSPNAAAAGTAHNMVIGKWKLERGHKATDWSPCYADIFTYSSETINVNI